MKNIPKQEYTGEFKEQAVEHVLATGIAAAVKELGSLRTERTFDGNDGA